jgi:hypothetical protein
MLHLGNLLITIKPYPHQPHLYNKWPLGQSRLLTPYVTLYYTEYIWDIDDTDKLEIVEVAHRRLAAGRRTIGLGIWFWISVLGIKI